VGALNLDSERQSFWSALTHQRFFFARRRELSPEAESGNELPHSKREASYLRVSVSPRPRLASCHRQEEGIRSWFAIDVYLELLSQFLNLCNPICRARGISAAGNLFQLRQNINVNNV